MKQIVIAINYVDYSDVRRKMAQEEALNVLSRRPTEFVSLVNFDFMGSSKPKIFDQYGLDGIIHLPILKRDSSVLINSSKRFPYIKEILNYCNRIKCDVFGYINSDILVPLGIYDILSANFDAFIFSRSEIGEIDSDSFIANNQKVIYGGNSHCGADGFFFRKSWWDENRDKFPDNLLIGATEWDTVYRTIIKNSGARYIEERSLYHVYHDQTWTTTSPSALNNIAIWDEVKKKYGVK